MKSLISRLEREADKLIDTLDVHPVARTLFDGTIRGDRYAEYLEQTQHYVRSARELLCASGARLLTQGQHPILARLLLEKAEEEAGHDAWARADLAALGLTGTESGPNVAVQAYVSTHRFEAEMGSGVAFLGTAYVLEALSARRATSTVRNLLEKSPIPGIEKAVSFLRAHGEADLDHIARLESILRGFTVPEDCEAMLRSARRTRQFFPGFFAAPRRALSARK
ncbi:MAG: iron-containing redox enzyme family protein [Polyangiaceae bacterium]